MLVRRIKITDKPGEFYYLKFSMILFFLCLSFASLSTAAGLLWVEHFQIPKPPALTFPTPSFIINFGYADVDMIGIPGVVLVNRKFKVSCMLVNPVKKTIEPNLNDPVCFKKITETTAAIYNVSTHWIHTNDTFVYHRCFNNSDGKLLAEIIDFKDGTFHVSHSDYRFSSAVFGSYEAAKRDVIIKTPKCNSE